MPTKHSIYTPDVLDLIDHARCATPGVDPVLFDADQWTKQAKATIQFFCLQCPVIHRCADVVLGPAKHAGFTGIAGGRVWRNGKPVRVPGTRRRRRNTGDSATGTLG